MSATAAAPQAGTETTLDPKRWAALAVLAVAQFMVVLDASIVNVALPSIQIDLGFSENGLQWVVNAYTLMFGGFLLLGGRAADLFGRRRVFMIGLIVFSAASLAGGFATSSGWLIVARGVQGLGAAIVSPVAMPQTNEAVVNSTRPARNTRLRPIRSPARPPRRRNPPKRSA